MLCIPEIRIPEKLWQTYKTTHLPPDLAWYQASVRNHHPDWAYQLLDDAQLRAEVAQHQPDLLAIFDAYKTPICRVDLARYVLLAAYGGVYLDLDFECLRPLAPLLHSHTLLIGLEPDSHLAMPAVQDRGFKRLLSPAFLASRAGHPFWQTVFSLIVEAHAEPDPLDATGPFLLTRALARYRDAETIALAPAELLHPLDKFECQQGKAYSLEVWLQKCKKAFAVHHWAGSWWQAADVRSALGSAELSVFVAGKLQNTLSHELVKPVYLAMNPSMMVSALMVTARRPALALAAIACFQAQDYPNCELVVVEDDTDSRLFDAIAALNDARIRLIKLDPGQLTLGELRNYAVRAARGAWVCQWDDDDLYDPARISVQMAAIQSQDADACFLSRWTIWWPQEKRFATSVVRLWEGSMLARKSLLSDYPRLRRGEDTDVAEKLFQTARVLSLDAPRLYLYVVHGANTFDAAHFDAHWQNASARYSRLDARRVKQQLAKRLDLERYLDAIHTSEKLILDTGEETNSLLRLYAPFAPGSGIATAAAANVAALRAAGLMVQTIELFPNDSELEIAAPPNSPKRRMESPQTVVIHANPDTIWKVLQLPSPQLDDRSFAARTCIGIWAWESPNTFRTAHLPAFAFFDEIWAPSEFARDAIARVSPIPVLCMPHAVPLQTRAPDRVAFGLQSDDFVFLCLFDALSQLVRKNPMAVISAFIAAFPAKQAGRAKLVIKTKNLTEKLRQTLHAAIANHPAIFMFDQHLDALQVQALLASSDVLVSLHRAEGFGLVLTEAMALGVPVMASAYSGNMTFMRADNSVLIDTQTYVLAADDGYFSAGTAWREADIAHAAERMRWLLANPEMARKIGLTGQAHIAEHLSYQCIGARMRARLQAQKLEQLRPMFRQTAARTQITTELPNILVATPVCNAERYLPRYIELLEGLNYPKDRLRLVMCQGNSEDQTNAKLQQLRPRIARIVHDFVLLKVDAEAQQCASWQHAELDSKDLLGATRLKLDNHYGARAALARARNQCLHQLESRDDWVLWLDPNLAEFPATMFKLLLAANAPIAHLRASQHNTVVLLVRSDVHRPANDREGIEFADFSYKGLMDIDAFLVQAREASFAIVEVLLSESATPAASSPATPSTDPPSAT